MFYTFSQNNSGGKFIDDGKVGVYTIIEATNLQDAINKALDIGIYFNGVDDGIDCECCGDRWSEPWEKEGTDVPTVYGKIVIDKVDSFLDNCKSYIHYANGTIKTIG